MNASKDRAAESSRPKTPAEKSRPGHALHHDERVEEARRIARRLHDEVQQLLFGIRLKSSMARARLSNGDTEALAEALSDIEDWAAEAIATVQELHGDLSPPRRTRDSRGEE